METPVIGDGIFTVKVEDGKVIITLCAWNRRKERKIIKLLDSSIETELRIHDVGYVYSEPNPEPSEKQAQQVSLYEFKDFKELS
ncbi:hypothetical protein H5T51_03920 [Candidatus Bathyarchaeota archaeon]|nr:hypothetical protein [Candidatus Bathyarchaeota archaeon]